jgi:spermidine synthase
MDKKMPPFIILLLAGGMGGIVAQTILLRELLIIFSGNELSIGVIIGTWVIWEALGAFAGGRFNKNNSINVFVLSIIIFSILFPASIYLTRIIKVLFSIPPGVGAGLIPILYSSALVLLPAGVLHGFFFTISCSMHDQLTGEGTSSTAKVYFYEMIGTIAGGILVSFIFIPYFNSFQIAFLVAFISSAACMVFLYPFSASKAGKGIFFAAAALTVSAIITLTFNVPDKIHRVSIAKQWQQQHVIFYENSIYQNVVVVENEDQFTFFADGIPVITTPVPDITFVEEFVHFPLLAHPNPEKVLVIGGGAGGLINEILKYKTIQKIDYVEIDPLLLKTVSRFSTPLTRKELGSQSVKIHYTDGKIFLKKSKEIYDAIFIGLPPPYTLQTNRFYTQEFFSLAKSMLNDKGMIVLTMPGSLAYYNSELKELNVSIFQTLKSVYPYVFILPGDFNLFIASPSSNFKNISPADIFDSLTSRNIDTKLITQPHIDYRFELKIRDWFFSTIGDTKSSINKDFSPKGLYYNISYQNLLFSPSLKFVFDSLKHLNIFSALCLIAAISFISFSLRKRIRHIVIPYAIATTGFSVMVFELILLFG